MSSALDVATWMFGRVQRDGELYQDDAAAEIEAKFGKRFIYENENGNPAIGREVLKHFRQLTERTVVWERGERYWRKRESSDPKNKRQADY